MKMFVRSALVLVPALLLAACGGGGGGGGGGTTAGGTTTPPATTATAVSITSANSKAVAADGLASATGTDDAQAASSLVTGVQVSGDSAAAPDTSRLATVAKTLAGMAASQPRLAVGVAVSEKENCPNGGSISVTGNVAGSGRLVTNDTVTLTADKCRLVIGTAVAELSGSMTLTVVSGSLNVSAPTYPQSIGLSVTTSNFSETSLGVTTVSDGDMRIELTETSASTGSVTLSGSSLRTTVTSAAGSRTAVLKSYRFTQGVAGTTVSTTISATVETTNTRIGSGTLSYQVSTPTPLVTDLGLVVSGSLKITGHNSALLLTVTSPNNFTLQVDANGDGTYESTTTTTKADLDALL